MSRSCRSSLNDQLYERLLFLVLRRSRIFCLNRIGYAGYGFDKHLPGASSSSARLRAHGGQECLPAERLSIALGGSIGRREEDEDKEKEEK
ncbi:hypothetical protein HZH68_004294 [Vespula germanica]|uniref:Uncharacterized protein n=1 Tax=Vespula germanica TaxID=30212 RepID=A0A834KNI1_VESGE|nr:hypothetical protein HZH68_004294 [Vespula germanica]